MVTMRIIFLFFLIIIQSFSSTVLAKGEREVKIHKIKRKQSLVNDITYTTLGAACLVGSYLVGTISKERYDAICLLWHDNAENILHAGTTQGSVRGHIKRWDEWSQTNSGKGMIAGEVIGLALLTGILGSTGIQFIAKGLHIKK